MIKRTLAIAALFLASGATIAAESGGSSGSYYGEPVGYHFTSLSRTEQGRNSAAILRAEAKRGSCFNKSSGGLANAEAVLWIYTMCSGRNTSVGAHAAIIHGRNYSLAGSLVNRTL
ncbi:hypothetical protein [Pseudoalteromonas luteoviolacea]|uniref:Uncharacterized protein n=1 Tax=Pseudoalteromonas luteoviolacea (strain 2ta16) TaxID=1353533 RepID=V4HY30_PSEL2|nr:hypothetical protein [Pseudoalteromonas luteoviolacea]ESP92834.1 hypothetical protein PL2TA16_04032 [Pseudoalteromonas luteoviolacea 2ta16]KZN35647.1 hypothetical protein N483_01420 [Pseudoalteromonas luteoviolacea NCIMB 1944]